jgi:hypothetical protein
MYFQQSLIDMTADEVDIQWIHEYQFSWFEREKIVCRGYVNGADAIINWINVPSM